jgi:hypothetical protein
MKSTLKVYSDGASRGNPGPSVTAFMILTGDGRILKKHDNSSGIRLYSLRKWFRKHAGIAGQDSLTPGLDPLQL